MKRYVHKPAHPDVVAGLNDAAILSALAERVDALTTDPRTHTAQTALIQAAGGGQLAYIETNYFGGTGSQAAAVFSAGEVIMRASRPISREPVRRNDPINTALRVLGVQALAGEDEFDAIGLSRFRDLESLGLTEWDDD